MGVSLQSRAGMHKSVWPGECWGVGKLGWVKVGSWKNWDRGEYWSPHKWACLSVGVWVDSAANCVKRYIQLFWGPSECWGVMRASILGLVPGFR